MHRIRLAFVAALAAFALGACSGGGGGVTPTAGGGGMTPTPTTPTPTTPTPSAGDRSGFFPIPSGHAIRVGGFHAAITGEFLRGGAGRWGYDDYRSLQTENPIYVDVPEAGSALGALVPEGFTSRNFPQFSVFQFGAAENADGIPLQKATKTEAGRYAAVAYQAMLEHSMLLFQSGIYNYAPAGRPDSDIGGRRGQVSLVTGNPYTGAPIAGTWKGKAFGAELIGSAEGIALETYDIDASREERLIVQGDVEIGVTLDGSGQNVTWALKNWSGGGGRVEWPDRTSENIPLDMAFSNDNHLFFRNISNYVELQFYGPGRQEAGGTFGFSVVGFGLRGIFAAKKQP